MGAKLVAIHVVMDKYKMINGMTSSRTLEQASTPYKTNNNDYLTQHTITTSSS
jgi:hypothetical protein